MKKEKLIAYYMLKKEIAETEKAILPGKFIQSGFVCFEKLREKLNNLYQLDDPSKHTLLEWMDNIMDKMETFDFRLLSEEEKLELTDSEGTVSILASDEHKYPHCIVKFKTMEEVADYIILNQ